MPMTRLERMALAQFFVGGLAVVFVACVLINHAQAQFVNSPPPSAATGLQSVKSQHRASTKVHSPRTGNTKRRSGI
jgi:hypothetical protein